MLTRSNSGVGIFAFAIASILTLADSTYGQGVYVSGVGAVNRSMGGAATGAPIDAIGALNWNPASIHALPTNELAVGVELLSANIDLNSSFGPGTSADNGFAAIPSIGWVQHLKGTPMTIGLGLYGVAGFKNNQPAGNAALGGAPAFAKADFLQVAPTVAYALNDTLTVGFAPTVTIGELGFDPVGPSVITPGPTAGQGNRGHWGIGFQTGVYYSENDLQMGLTFKSPQWMETFRFFTPTGIALFDMDLPMVVSLGFGYTGISDWTFAADVRYFGYEDTDGFDVLGWDSIFAFAFGAQRHLSESVTVRLGINFNENPIGAGAVATNALSPLIQRYNVSAGFTYHLVKGVDFNVAYAYLGRSDVTGPAAGGTVTSEISGHSGIVGVTVRY